jgi:hypothetical protein
VSFKGSYLDLKKIIDVETFPVPRTITNANAFFGFIRYYCKFILRYVRIIELLFGLTKKECKFV